MSSNPRVPLSYHVFVAPEKPFNGPAPRVGDSPAWGPTTSTLILGAPDAVLVDALATVPEATALADWVPLHDRRLTTIYITHATSSTTDSYAGQPYPTRSCESPRSTHRWGRMPRGTGSPFHADEAALCTSPKILVDAR